MRLVGTQKSVDLTGNQFRQAFALKSDWFNITVPPPPVREPRSIDTACPSGMPTGAFSDVDPASPHARAIDCVAWRDIAEGTGGGRFSPTRDVTRAQMASFVARMIEVTGGRQLPTSFPDAFDDDNGSVHEMNINRLAAAGIVNGVSARTYQPNQPIDRAQLASILARALKFLGVALPSSPPGAFSDDNGSVHETAIDQLAAEGVVAGTGPGTYSPKASAHRDQMASMLARALDLALSS
jgi:ribosomal protein S19E (S16A)